ncbi:acyl-coenzyme A thioesterase 11 isoform X2 [Oncorhynchus tshawytscha]|uniref:acyl-coenzyme A thioesterase 11 isoform X2 n=1 Tax=Oncorhynchus tshawytscha TaxID=74940 RepID=UPI000D0A5B67|nr:acyl-coenzyme A thioesterase 11 isoform X2 [Oncorhynchus tshawytscha]XP_024276746.1 acyl-coenzyme A thioesterase 11 isoform X2 [Oncorhynchus tshawytscha]XP_024276747.1 acyl-coenzyme A thioesterase 11 isoform X2 [Oncorhynchus tshawytscha]XP_024276748.1 acyl-coenzyme A thioesterase 11 isoform X2 [Oncorhynchus tshawytscha]XP_042177903.1 acyl-coenzyme A thioesterase 11 isoform X2 [Oncorhynchus tshawytscha]XP_042177904.1 acyl-coenzyme A thioesterase 11 isoform X2 [Oncorhynchus tshawytscha]
MGREGVVSGVRTFLDETASTYVLLCTVIQADVTGSSAYHFSLAERHAGSPCITNSVDDVHFDHTIGVGQVVNIKAKVNRAFTSSMEMQVIPRTQTEQMEYSIAAERRRRRMRLIPAEIITDLLSSSTAQLGSTLSPANKRRCLCLYPGTSATRSVCTLWRTKCFVLR